MKVLVSFQPNKKASDFEGARLRKTIKGSLEILNVEYTTSIVDKFDIMHLISSEDDNKANDAKESNIPLVISALYCEDDPLANYIEYKSKDGTRFTGLKKQGLKFLNKANVITVPSQKGKEFLMENGVKADIQVVPPGINMSRFDFSREDEKDIFYRYFRENRSKRLVVAMGEYDNNMDGINAFINAAKKCPDVLFYYIGRESVPGVLKSFKMSRLINSSPKNVKFHGIIPDDVYRSALMNADVFMLPGYKVSGVVALFDAMAAKCQLIVRDQAVFSDLLEDGKTAYLAQYSETLTSLTKDYFQGKLKPTIEKAYQVVSKHTLEEFGEQIKWVYQQQLNIKNS
ncbi:MAG: glycosyltransferase [Bacilli bacterium]|nr:glycosyltransferase [Bacilli bacterium]